MTDTLDILLMPRAELIAQLVGPRVAGKREWWAEYNRHEGLRTGHWTDTRVDYRRPGVGSASIVLDQIQGRNLKDVHETDPIELDSKIIDAASIVSRNKKSNSPIDWSYTGEFEKTISKEEAFEKSFDQTIETFYEQGGDAAGFKAGIKTTLGFHQSDSSSTSETERVNRSFSFGGSTPPGEDERLTAWRKVSRMKSEVVGIGDYNHTIKIGKHWHGSWQGGRHSWDSFDDLLRVIKGEAPTSYDLANRV